MGTARKEKLVYRGLQFQVLGFTLLPMCYMYWRVLRRGREVSRRFGYDMIFKFIIYIPLLLQYRSALSTRASILLPHSFRYLLFHWKPSWFINLRSFRSNSRVSYPSTRGVLCFCGSRFAATSLVPTAPTVKSQIRVQFHHIET